MIVLAWLLSLVVAFLAGYHYQKLTSTVSALKEAVAARRKGQEEPEEPSVVIDPDDVVQMAKFEHEQRMRELNPEDYE